MDPLISESAKNAVALIAYMMVGVSLVCLVLWIVAVVRLMHARAHHDAADVIMSEAGDLH